MEATTHNILITLAAAVFLGISAQVLAHRFRLPAILPLLLLGMFAGPSGLGIFDPHTLGPTLEVIVHLGVAVILFEGGLLLVPKQLRQIGGPLRNLLVVGTAITWAGAAWLAQAVTGASWATAALFGAIVTVTGPTVIGPLLRHMIVPKRTRTLLLSEGLMIDPIGAVLAYFVLQWIERADMSWRELLRELLELALTGSLLGLVAGVLAVLAVRHRRLEDELRNLVILALLLGSFAVAEHQAPQSGILGAVVMGLTVSASNLPNISPLRAFKGQLTVLVISILFILLSGQLDLGSIWALGWGGMVVVAGLILLVRPLSVFLSIPPSQLSFRERMLLGLTAPRGIVAAAVASLAAIELNAMGQAENATILEGMVYLVILVTCGWATAMAGVLPRWLGFADDPSRRKVVLVGANTLSIHFAKVLVGKGWQALIIDGARAKAAELRSQQLQAIVGDARDAVTYEHAEVERDTRVLALTTNDELNLLVANLVRDEFGVHHPVVALQRGTDHHSGQTWLDLLGGRELDLPTLDQKLCDGRLKMFDLDLEGGVLDALRILLRERADEVVLLCAWRNSVPSFHWTSAELDNFLRVTLLGTPELETQLRSRLPREPGEETLDLSLTEPLENGTDEDDDSTEELDESEVLGCAPEDAPERD